MTNPKQFKSEAIILKIRPLGERDRLVTFFSPTLGRHSAIIKSKSGLEPISYHHLVLYKGKSLDLITESQTLSPFAGIRDSFNAMSMAGYFCEVITKATSDGQENQPLFDILKASLSQLDNASPILSVRDQFHHDVLIAEGLSEQEATCSPEKFLSQFSEYCGARIRLPVMLS
jgi:DNA repair protein RecO (recombination protein O)